MASKGQEMLAKAKQKEAAARAKKRRAVKMLNEACGRAAFHAFPFLKELDEDEIAVFFERLACLYQGAMTVSDFDNKEE